MNSNDKTVYAAVGGIGDVNSTERGSGARYNSGKPELSLIPADFIGDFMITNVLTKDTASYHDVFGDLMNIQAKSISLGTKTVMAAARVAEAAGLSKWDAIAECARVFMYGRSKYAAWNWAKGMSWSAVLDSALRHLVALMLGEERDAESGLHHAGHFLCNMVMLYTYTRVYREGDDLPGEVLR